MGVQLNIKNPATVRLARDLAAANGTTMTQAVHAALEQVAAEREVRIRQRLADFTAFADEIYASLPDDAKTKTSKELMDAIYDDDADDGFAR